MPDATTSHFLLAMPFSKAQDAQPALAPTPASRSTPSLAG